MKMKKVTAVFLIISLLLPIWPPAAMAAEPGPVAYSRANPEVSILNAYTGSSAIFYESLMSDTSLYNAIDLFQYTNLGTAEPVFYSDMVSMTTVEYPDFEDSVLNELSWTRGNLKGNLSGTFHNNWHTHSFGLLGLGGSQEILASSSLELRIKGDYVGPILHGSSKHNEENARLGNMKYGIVNNMGTGYPDSALMKLNFFRNKISDLKDNPCTCGGHYVTKIVVAFMDDRAPLVESVIFKNASGEPMNKGSFGAGDTIKVEVNYDEFIRFADDSNLHDDLYIGLQIEGLSPASYPKAMLKELNNKTLYFEYEVETEPGKFFTITGVDLSPLMAEDLPLKQIWRGSNFDIEEVPTDMGGKTTGFTTSKAYITDLAGNAITEKSIPGRAYIDTTELKIDEIKVYMQPNNQEVKDDLGKTNPQAMDYLYKSDNYLGVVDSLSLSFLINKRLDIPLIQEKGTVNYFNLLAHTNWEDESGNPISMQSGWAYDYYNSAGEEVTHISMRDMVITADMASAIANEALKITSLEFINGEPPFRDLAGTAYTQLDLTGLAIPMAAVYLDTAAPTVDTTASSSIIDGDEVYNVVPISLDPQDLSFSFPFQVSDDSSGVAGLKGSFAWYAEGLAEPYDYVVTAKSSLDASEDWQRGETGRVYEFTQVGEEQYIFIRPLVNHEYSLNKTELWFFTKDYAGNRQAPESPISFSLDASWDNLAPRAQVDKVKRSPDGSGGWTLKVEVQLEDSLALSDEFYYSWLDFAPNLPLTGGDISAWAPVTTIDFDSGDQRSGRGTATNTIPSGGVFDKHLVVKAKDTSGNESLTYLGDYKYDLSAIEYSLEYSTKITNSASLKMLAVGNGEGVDYSGGTLLFMIPAPGRSDLYFVSFDRFYQDVLGGYADYEHSGEGKDPRDIFAGPIDMGDPGDNNGDQMDWTLMEVVEDDGTYGFTIFHEEDDDYPLDTYLRTIIEDYSFTGDLSLTVLAGSNDAFNMESPEHSDQLYPTSATAISVEEINLRVSSTKAGLAASFTGMNFSTNNIINTKHDPGFWDKGSHSMLSTAEGIEVQINLGTDVNGWNYEDIDYASSYVEIIYQGSDASWLEDKKIYLAPRPIQTLVLPKADYPTGYYQVNLLVNCKAGQGYTLSLGEQIYIDNSSIVEDFAISSLTYEVDNYRDAAPWHNVDGSINYYNAGELLYLPVNSAGAKGEATITNIMKVAIDENQTPETYALVAWNATAGQGPEDASYSVTRETDYERSFLLTTWDTASQAISETGQSQTVDGNTYTTLGLIRNQANTIAVQVLNANGKKSPIRYYIINPVAEEFEGELSFSQAKDGSNLLTVGNLVFTPAAGQSLVGTSLYVSVAHVDSEGNLHKKDGLQGQEMLAQGDGTYTYPLLAGKYVYSVYAIDAYGNLTILGELDSVIVDQESPKISLLNSSVSDGLYEAKFKLEDDSLSAVEFQEDSSWLRSYQPLAIRLRFDKGRADWLGIEENVGLELTLNEDGEDFIWLASEASPTGIYEVRASRQQAAGPESWYTEAWLEISVKGVVGYNTDDTGAQDFSLIMDATDALGNSTKPAADSGVGSQLYGSADFSNVDPVKAEPIINGLKAPAYIDTAVDYDKALQIHFTSPVLPKSSWINPEPEYGMIQTDAFPITEDGSWIISYQDIFGSPYQEELTLTDVFQEKGLSLSIHPMELTTEAVEILVKTLATDSEGRILVFKKMEDGSLSALTDINGDSETPLADKAIKIDENQTLVIMHYPELYDANQLFNQGYYRRADRLEVEVDNIVQGAPSAQAYFYFEANGSEYNLDGLSALLPMETSGDVRVWYKTSRNVIPSNDTGSSHIFKYGSQTNHSFTYVDDFSNQGQLDIDLAALGITLTEPGAAPVDKNAPMVKVNLKAKRYGTYRDVESFGDYSSRQSIEDAFTAANYVQAYLLTLNVDDQSAYKIVIKATSPSSISYADAVSDNIAGISLASNTISITEARDFTIVIVDNAMAETNAPADNASYIEVKASDIADWLDKTPPEAEVKGEWENLYQKNFYIKLSDKNDQGDDTGPVSLDSPKLETETADGDYKGWYKKIFTTNTSEDLFFYDIAGNMGRESLRVDNIDESLPELRTTWYPYYINPDNPSDINKNSPPSGPINTDVTATVFSSTVIDQLTLEYSNDNGQSWGAEAYASVSYRQLADQVILTFTASNYGVRLTVTGPNGKAATETIYLGANVIDKVPITIGQELEYKYRQKSDVESYPVAYGAKITLTPDKPSYALNVGQRTVLYDSERPLIINTDENETKTYLFADASGNHSEITVTTTGIDTRPAKLTVSPENTFGLAMTAGSVAVDITSDEAGWAECQGTTYDLTANVAQSISFTENGVYIIKAYDQAGNFDSISVTVGNIDKVAPKISFDKSSISVKEGTSALDLQALMETGVIVWDNLDSIDQLDWSYEDLASAVNLASPGLYPVTYTVTDSALNQGQAIRYVKVISKDLPMIIIGADKFTEPDGITVLPLGTHSLAVEGLREIAAGISEPYSLKIRRGMLTEGQMKYFKSSLSVVDGKISLDQEGFYTIYIISQSRQSYRTLLYVER